MGGETRIRGISTRCRMVHPNTQVFYLAFCTPAKADDEFLMTENGYGIYEGPVSALERVPLFPGKEL